MTDMPPGWTGSRSGEVEALLAASYDPCHEATEEARDTAVRLEGRLANLHDLIRTYLLGSSWAETHAALVAMGRDAGVEPPTGATGRWSRVAADLNATNGVQPR